MTMSKHDQSTGGQSMGSQSADGRSAANHAEHVSAPESARDEMAALLPFYFTGALDAEEKARIERWLAEDPGAEAALANLEAERAACVQANEAIAPPAGALARLTKRLAAEPERRPSPAGRLRKGLADAKAWLEALPASLAWGAAAVLLALTVAQGVFLEQMRTGAPAGGDGVTVATGEAERSGAMTLVAFAPEATIAEITAALEDVDAMIVSGPRAGRLFEVRFVEGEGLAPAAERMKRLAARKPLVQLLSPMGGAKP